MLALQGRTAAGANNSPPGVPGGNGDQQRQQLNEGMKKQAHASSTSHNDGDGVGDDSDSADDSESVSDADADVAVKADKQQRKQHAQQTKKAVGSRALKVGLGRLCGRHSRRLCNTVSDI